MPYVAALDRVRAGVGTTTIFFESLKPRKPLKSLVSDERIQENPSQLKRKIGTKIDAILPKADESKGFQIPNYHIASMFVIDPHASLSSYSSFQVRPSRSIRATEALGPQVPAA